MATFCPITGQLLDNFMKDIVTISNVKGTLRIRFWYKGKRISISPGLSYEELSKYDRLLLTLRLDIENECLDESLDKYRLRKKKEVRPKVYPVTDLFIEWVTTYKKGDISKSGYGAIYHMIKSWGNKVENFPELLGKQKLAASTYNRRKNSLCKFIEWGIYKGYFKSNPLLFTDSMKESKKKKSGRLPLTNEEVLRFLSAIKGDTFSSKYSPVPHSFYYPFFYFIFRTGLRNQEAVGLKVKYIDFVKFTLHINEVAARESYRGGRLKIFKETKTGKDRLIPLPKDLLELLKAQCFNKGSEDLVFTSPQGKIIDAQNLQKRVFKPVLKLLNIPERDLYAARHSFANRCLESQISVANTAYLMGNTPRTIYLHYADVVNKPDSLPDIK